MKKNNRILWVGIGAGLLLIGFLLLARYAPNLEFMWDVLNGTVAGIPYRYILIVVLVYTLSGGCFYKWLQSLKASCHPDPPNPTSRIRGVWKA
jgi:hypothetical protein